MFKQKCNGCGKVMEAGAGSKLCSLCAMGLTPGRQVDMAVSYQGGLSVSQRDDSGMDCPRCHANLSVADMTRQKCPYCHATVAASVIPARSGLTPHWKRRPTAQPERKEPTRIWPENAPIR